MNSQAYVEQWEQKHFDRGALAGARELIALQLSARFGAIDPATAARLQAASLEQLRIVATRVVTVERIEDAFDE